MIPIRTTIKALRKNPWPAEVARQLHLSQATVYRHAIFLDLKLLREIGGDKEKEAVIIKSLSKTHSSAEIARKLGVSRNYINVALRENESA